MSAQSGRLPAPTASSLGTHPWWQLAILGAVLATVLNLVVYAIAVGVADVDLLLPAGFGSSELWEAGVAPIVIFSVLPALLAAGLAALLARLTAAPRRWFVGIALVILALSFVPSLQLDVSTGAKLTLVLMHVAAAAGILFALLPRLSAEEDRGRR